MVARARGSHPARMALAIAAFGLLLGSSCRRPYRVGDHVMVEWRGAYYPAVIVGMEGSSRFRIHYDGYGDDWEEWITATKIQERLPTSTSASPAAAMPRPIARTSASASSPPQPPSVYRIGDRVRVEWRGTIYPATVITVLGGDRYRVHYDTYGQEWDENVGLNRIQRK